MTSQWRNARGRGRRWLLTPRGDGCHDEFDPAVIICPPLPAGLPAAELARNGLDSRAEALTMRNLRRRKRWGRAEPGRNGAGPNGRDREHRRWLDSTEFRGAGACWRLFDKRRRTDGRTQMQLTRNASEWSTRLNLSQRPTALCQTSTFRSGAPSFFSKTLGRPYPFYHTFLFRFFDPFFTRFLLNKPVGDVARELRRLNVHNTDRQSRIKTRCLTIRVAYSRREPIQLRIAANCRKLSDKKCTVLVLVCFRNCLCRCFLVYSESESVHLFVSCTTMHLYLTFLFGCANCWFASLKLNQMPKWRNVEWKWKI